MNRFFLFLCFGFLIVPLRAMDVSKREGVECLNLAFGQLFKKIIFHVGDRLIADQLGAKRVQLSKAIENDDKKYISELELQIEGLNNQTVLLARKKQEWLLDVALLERQQRELSCFDREKTMNKVVLSITASSALLAMEDGRLDERVINQDPMAILKCQIEDLEAELKRVELALLHVHEQEFARTRSEREKYRKLQTGIDLKAREK